jgi:hypothetical protein
MEPSPLIPCIDCKAAISKYAEACPHCGRFFQGYKRTIKVIPGDGWSMTVFWGMMLAWIIPLICLVVLAFVLVGIAAR